MIPTASDPPHGLQPTSNPTVVGSNPTGGAQIEVAVRNGGFRDGIKALSWAHAWIHVQVAFGRDPSVDEVAEWWKESRRTAFREQAAFRKCFPTLDSPAEIYADPKMMKNVRAMVEALEKMDAAKRTRKAAKDADVLNAGLLNPGA